MTATVPQSLESSLLALHLGELTRPVVTSAPPYGAAVVASIAPDLDLSKVLGWSRDQIAAVIDPSVRSLRDGSSSFQPVTLTNSPLADDRFPNVDDDPRWDRARTTISSVFGELSNQEVGRSMLAPLMRSLDQLLGSEPFDAVLSGGSVAAVGLSRRISQIVDVWRVAAELTTSVGAVPPSWLADRILSSAGWEAADVHRGGVSLLHVKDRAGDGAAFHHRSTDALRVLGDTTRLVSPLAEHQLGVPQIESSPFGDWVEWIDGEPLGSLPIQDRASYDRSLGVLVGLLVAFGVTGLEPESLIVRDDVLYIVQLDGFLAPGLGSPAPELTIDDWSAVLPACFSSTVFDQGFEDAAIACRRVFSDVVDFSAAIETRVFPRNTVAYARVLHAMDQPQIVQDWVLRDLVASNLARVPDVYEPAVGAVLAKHEIQDLRCGDIPYLTTSPTSHTVWFDEHRAVDGLILKSGLQAAQDRV